MSDLQIPPATAQCRAITKSGQPCRNHALDGQLYCRIHAGLAEAGEPGAPIDGTFPTPNSAVPGEEEILIATAEPADERAMADSAVQELEVEIRNHEEGQPEARD